MQAKTETNFLERFPSLSIYAERCARAFYLLNVEPERVPHSILETGFGLRLEPEALALRAVQVPVERAEGSFCSVRSYVWTVASETDAAVFSEEEAMREERMGAERVVVLVSPIGRRPYVLAPMFRTAALASLAKFHAPHAVAWEAHPASKLPASVGVYRLVCPIGEYPAGALAFGEWHPTRTDERGEPMLEIFRAVDASSGAFLSPHVKPGSVFATLEDVEPEGSATLARSWEFEDCGTDHAQYFRGAGPDDYADVSIGTGNSAGAALEDALAVLSDSGWDVSAAAVDIRKRGTAEAWERDTVSEELAREVRPAKARVRFVASCGMTTREETFDDPAHALNFVSTMLDTLRGFHGQEDTDELAPADRNLSAELAQALEAHDANFRLSWESRAPEDCAMIPDTDGEIVLDILRGTTLEELSEDCELSHYVVVRVSDAIAD